MIEMTQEIKEYAGFRRKLTIFNYALAIGPPGGRILFILKDFSFQTDLIASPINSNSQKY